MNKKWQAQRIEVQKCAAALRKANEQGKEIPAAVFVAMAAKFTSEEIGAIDAYLMYVSEGKTGADYLTPDQMEGQRPVTPAEGGQDEREME